MINSKTPDETGRNSKATGSEAPCLIVPEGVDPKFSSFLEAAPDAIVVVNHDGVIVMANQLVEKLFGYARSDLIGQKVEILVPDRFRVAHVAYRSGYSEEPKTRAMGEGRELSGKRRDGTEFPVEISLSPLETESESLVISIIRDIGPRKKMEAKFRGLLESAPDGIVVVDTSGKITVVNSQTEKLFGYSRDELIGRSIEVLVPDQYKMRHVQYRSDYVRNPRTRPMGAGRALTGRTKSGAEFPVEISLSPLETEQGTLIMSIIRDITDRRKAEQDLQASLHEKEKLLSEKTALLTEKESLLKEIHHRVKNNLQITSSLLRLQADYIEDPQARRLFAESQNRIKTMALVHEKLYRAQNLSKIDFAEYIKDLAQLLFRSYAVDTSSIHLILRGGSISLSIETAVPCGLIVNELLSNCLKHAFPNGRGGEIRIEVGSQTDSGVIMEVADNGVGLPQGFDFDKSETLGLQLVRTLVRQIKGQVQIRTNPGTSFRISFNDVRKG